MEDKQKAILELTRSLLNLIRRLTYFDEIPDKNAYWDPINRVYMKIDDFVNVCVTEQPEKSYEAAYNELKNNKEVNNENLGA